VKGGSKEYIGSTGIVKVRYTLKVALRAACNERRLSNLSFYMLFIYLLCFFSCNDSQREDRSIIYNSV
jgi:hypothetical protein